MEIRPASDRSLLVSFGDRISLESHSDVLRLLRAFEELPRGILNLHPAYASVLIDFDPRRATHGEIERLVRARWEEAQAMPMAEPRRLEIPVRYGGECGPDLEDVARYTGFSAAEIVRRHTSAEYVVYFLGFSPGFPYLGGLPPELAIPRLPAPRKEVPAGSVAIGGSQTGIYPMSTPGGWRLIGRTTVRLFDAAANPPALLRTGDRIRFVPLP
ncbi:MAG TPA: 5-oxoprolinase subunit PxpB [Bryobacteraceae bacterium]|nr:5-oxoprolinase subunit PxpB [Bryobacteraceae bacterium]